MVTDFNKNERQMSFNELKGVIHQIVDDEHYPHIILEIGHEKKRFVDIRVEKNKFNQIVEQGYSVGQSVCIMFYINSKEKDGRWYTTANLIGIGIKK